MEQGREVEVTKYPLEVASIVRTQTFSVESHLALARAADGDSPFKVFKKLSRFIFALINEQKESVMANIPVYEIAGIEKKTEYAFNKNMEATFSPKPQDETLSPAYTVKITSGTFKGKTPAAVLLENPENRAALISQWQWLKSNLNKYPNNQKQMDAIVEAANLEKAGELSSKMIVEDLPIEIYKAEMRPLQSKKRNDGLWFVYAVKIVWIPGNTYPVEICIENYYAPVEKNEKLGTLNVKIKERDQSSLKKVVMKLTADEWLDTMRAIKTNMDQFQMLHAKEVFNDALSTSDKARKSSK